ncbi:hypothetical protein QN277_005718 [Acacia crassicarpa]|uniref:F-box domain-containing protein n=1 Tax=Acacia crassicarpa TaxID=499986 RepID=A0AAE1J090_9FABA|nr:hypothetical protein QN277_005718 [Acacia crassicarpa]
MEMEVNGTVPFLPEEIITDILKRLPVKSLIRFRCVCQHWKNLVKNPSFITDHLRHSGHHNPNFLFFRPSSSRRDYTASLDLLNCEMQVRDLQKAPLIDYLWAGRFKIIGCSNGLLCVVIHSKEIPRPPSSVLLWNPATKDVTEVTRPRTIDSCKFSCKFGFGFNSSLNDFKIVAIDDQIDRMGVYSLSRDSWKEIELKNFPEDFKFFDETAVSSNEAIFWKGQKGREEGKGVIVSFDTTKEVFTFIPWPTDTASLSFVNLTVYKDKLAIFHSGSDGSLWVWVMEEDIGSSRERWNWSKKFIGCHYPQMFNCVGTIWRNDIVIVGNTETTGKEGPKRHLCMVNLTTNQFKMIDSPQYCPVEFLNYVESLVPIFNIHNIEEPKTDVSWPGSSLWGEIWKLQIPERCKMFLWLALHKQLLTNVSRCKRGLSTDARCPICNGEIETLLHVLRDCPATADLWKQLVPMNLWLWFC